MFDARRKKTETERGRLTRPRPDIRFVMVYYFFFFAGAFLAAFLVAFLAAFFVAMFSILPSVCNNKVAVRACIEFRNSYVKKKIVIVMRFITMRVVQNAS
jgi:hypothetical protein